MNVEYTGRHYVVTSIIRKEVETGLTKIRKILGDRFETKVILSVEKHRNTAEITISPRNGLLVGLAQAKDMSIAVNEALDHLEKQAVKYKTRWQSKKRSARKNEETKKWNGHSTAPDQNDLQTVIGLSEKTAVPVMVHRYPAVAKTTEVHLLRSDENVEGERACLTEVYGRHGVGRLSQRMAPIHCGRSDHRLWVGRATDTLGLCEGWRQLVGVGDVRLLLKRRAQLFR